MLPSRRANGFLEATDILDGADLGDSQTGSTFFVRGPKWQKRARRCEQGLGDVGW
jgi:hypothetical protein